MTRNEKYWAERAERRMDAYVLSAEEQARVVRRSYNQTRAYVQSEIEKILHHVGGEDSLAYEYRMKRLTALLQNTEKRIKELYGITVEDTTEFLKSIIPEAYYHTIFDIAKGTGIEPNFAAVNEKLINSIVKEPWSGKNYSKRIWSNMDKLETELRDVLTDAAMNGESIGKTSRKVAESFNTASYNAERLIRTETTYACNQAELASYEELDIDRYKFVATLDTRTSPICQKMDGRVFKTKDAKAGQNLPAMHPNCRSTTIPYFEDFEPEERAARDADGNPIKVPANMTYPEWYDKYVKPKEQQKGPKTPPQPPKGKDAPKKPEPEKTPNTTPTEVEIPQPDIKPDYTDTPIPKRPVEVPRPEPRPAQEAPKVEKPEAGTKKRPAEYKEKVTTVEKAVEYLSTVFANVEKNVTKLAEKLVIDNTEHLRKLNNRFGALKEGNAGFFSGSKLKKQTIAETGFNLRTTDINLVLSGSEYSSAEHLIAMESQQIKEFFHMPVSEEYITVSSITHEYGHILEYDVIYNKRCAEQYQKYLEIYKDPLTRSKGKKLILDMEKQESKKIFNEILDIAKKNNPEFSMKANLSKYGHKDYFEAFAEIFANSQCGAPNELGKAMQIWLEKEGF